MVEIIISQKYKYKINLGKLLVFSYFNSWRRLLPIFEVSNSCVEQAGKDEQGDNTNHSEEEESDEHQEPFYIDIVLSIFNTSVQFRLEKIRQGKVHF